MEVKMTEKPIEKTYLREVTMEDDSIRDWYREKSELSLYHGDLHKDIEYWKTKHAVSVKYYELKTEGVVVKYLDDCFTIDKI
jgi:hypothetical protein